MATIDKALQIASKAHEGQKEKDGLPAYKFLTGLMTEQQYRMAMKGSA